MGYFICSLAISESEAKNDYRTVAGRVAARLPAGVVQPVHTSDPLAWLGTWTQMQDNRA